MKTGSGGYFQTVIVVTAVLVSGLCHVAMDQSLAGDDTAAITAGLNPYAGMQERQEVFEFVKKPSVSRQGEKTIVEFETKAACDATVAIVGPDEKVLRHLASGVLGKNAPAPFKQGSLAQSLEWDGKDDDGKPAPAGCKVKVSLGLKAEFDKIQKQLLFSFIREMAVDKEGCLYVAMANGVLSESVHVFDRQGKMVRTIWPMPAGTPAAKNGIFVWNKTTSGLSVPLRNRYGGGWGYDLMPGKSSMNFFWDARRHTAAALPDGRVLVVSAGSERGGTKVMFLNGMDGSCPAGCYTELAKGFATAGVAVSPDGKWIYYAGKKVGHAKPGASHAIQRAPVEKPGETSVFAGEIAVSGADEKHFDGPVNVACDKDGNVYVVDTGNRRIQVFKPDGTLLKSIPDIAGDMISISHKTGAIYVLAPPPKGNARQVSIVKLASLANPTKVADLVLNTPKGAEAFNSAMIVADHMSEPPAFWVSANYRPPRSDTLVRIEDRGDKLEQTVDAWTANGVSVETGENEIGLNVHQYYISSNKKTGEVADGSAVGPDGLWYSYARADGYYIVRFDPKKNEYVPFANNSVQVGCSWNPKAPWVHNGKPVTGIKLPAHIGSSHDFQSPFDVAPNGDIYAVSTFTKPFEEEITKAGFFAKVGIYNHIVQVYGADGNLKSKIALSGLKDADGLRVGRKGAVYLVQGAQPLTQALPDGLAAGSQFHQTRWGSVIKFNSSFDKFPIGKIVGGWEGQDDKPTHKQKGTKGLHFENALWTYGGVSPVSADYNTCSCLKASFDLDLYERSFVPAGHTYTVNAIDANGNVVARLGGYGNRSDLVPGKPPAFDIPRSVAVTDTALWVHDAQLRALVKSKLIYAMEETTPIK